MDYKIELPEKCEMYTGKFHSVRAEISGDQRRIEENESSGISLCTLTQKGMEYRVIDSLDEIDKVEEKLKDKPNYVLPPYKMNSGTYQGKKEEAYIKNDAEFITEERMVRIYEEASDILKANGFEIKKLLLDEETASYSIWKGKERKGGGTYKIFSPGIEFSDPVTQKVFLQYDVFATAKVKNFLESVHHIQKVQDGIKTKSMLMLTPNALSSLIFALLFYLSRNFTSETRSRLSEIPILSKVIINSPDNKIVEGTIDGDGNFYNAQALFQDGDFSGLVALKNQRWKVDYKAAPISRPHKIAVEKGKVKFADLLNSGEVALVNDFKFENSIDFQTMDFFSTITINIYKNDQSIVGQRSFPYKGNVIHILQHIINITSDRQYGANMILAPYALTDIEI